MHEGLVIEVRIGAHAVDDKDAFADEVAETLKELIDDRDGVVGCDMKQERKRNLYEI